MRVSQYRRPVFGGILTRLSEPRRFLQVLAGPRQVGKTTLARQVIETLPMPSVLASADDPMGQDLAWLRAEWQRARGVTREAGATGALLVLDEVQKILGWSDLVKLLWDEDSASGLPLRVLVLGSSPLLVQRGLSDSLAGPFELLRVTHWSFVEMRDAFGWDVERYVLFGGYPGAAALVDDADRWRRYVQESLIETSISRDILLMTRVDKPALLRQLFGLACDYSGQVLSYRKMLGQLQDAGNATTLAHYLRLLSGAGMVTGLEKFTGSRVLQRASSPKLLVLNTALMTAVSNLSPSSMREDPRHWGRLVETAVGAHLANDAASSGFELFYWREENREVDFVQRAGPKLLAIEVTSGRRKGSLPGMDGFAKRFGTSGRLLVGGQGVPLEEFLARPAEAWLD